MTLTVAEATGCAGHAFRLNRKAFRFNRNPFLLDRKAFRCNGKPFLLDRKTFRLNR